MRSRFGTLLLMRRRDMFEQFAGSASAGQTSGHADALFDNQTAMSFVYSQDDWRSVRNTFRLCDTVVGRSSTSFSLDILYSIYA
jgi:hypothetical protein